MSHQAPIETDLFRDLLSLVEHMVTDATDNGMPRTPGVVSITTQGASWVVEVLDPDNCRAVRVLGLTCDGTLMMASELLRLNPPPWAPVKVRYRR